MGIPLIIGGIVALYAAMETGSYLSQHREVELPKKNEEDPTYTLHGSYFQYLFKSECGICEEDQYRAYHRRSHIYRYRLPMDQELHHDCKGHTRDRYMLWDDFDIPEDSPRYVVDGGSKYTTHLFTRKLSNFARMAFRDFRETFFPEKQEMPSRGLHRVFSDDSLCGD